MAAIDTCAAMVSGVRVCMLAGDVYVCMLLYGIGVYTSVLRTKIFRFTILVNKKTFIVSI